MIESIEKWIGKKVIVFVDGADPPGHSTTLTGVDKYGIIGDNNWFTPWDKINTIKLDKSPY
jgi:hypothetical protein